MQDREARLKASNEGFDDWLLVHRGAETRLGTPRAL